VLCLQLRCVSDVPTNWHGMKRTEGSTLLSDEFLIQNDQKIRQFMSVCFRRFGKISKKKRLIFVLSVCPSVRMEQLGSHWADIHESWYWCTLWKFVHNVQFSFTSSQNSGYITWRPNYVFIISRSVILRMRNVSDKFAEKIRHAFDIL